jgi:hypothetical protein
METRRCGGGGRSGVGCEGGRGGEGGERGYIIESCPAYGDRHTRKASFEREGNSTEFGRKQRLKKKNTSLK